MTKTTNGWLWRLFDAETCLAVAPRHYDGSKAARTAIDHVRDAVATLEEFDAFDYRRRGQTGAKPRLRIRGDDSETFEWSLERDGKTLAKSSFTCTTRENAREAATRFGKLAVGAIPVYYAGAEEGVEFDPFEVGMSEIRGAMNTLLTRGRQHRRFLSDIDTRIVVSGTRGKSSTVRRLDDVFNRRGYDVLTKITGNQPVLIRNRDVIPVEREGPYTTLYENIKVIRALGSQLKSYAPEDALIFENQGITEYTTRLINERFVKPHIVVVANVRQDHQDTLGKTPSDIARAFARSIPSGTRVVNGEQNPVLSEYMREEIEQQGGEMTQVTIPDDQEGRLGAETVYAINDVLRLLDMEPVAEEQLNAYLDTIQPQWVNVPGGRVFNGAEINDVESTEAIRKALAGENYVLPFVYLRADRRGRTASFAKYLNTLADRDLIERAHAGGTFTGVFASNVDVPVVEHDRSEDAGKVLDDMLATEYPVLLMGNTVDEFMRRMEETITERAQEKVVEKVS